MDDLKLKRQTRALFSTSQVGLIPYFSKTAFPLLPSDCILRCREWTFQKLPLGVTAQLNNVDALGASAPSYESRDSDQPVQQVRKVNWKKSLGVIGA